jgi:hypothetical protein
LCRCHPLGRVSTGKTLLSSIFFIESSWAAKILSTGRIRSLHFGRMIPVRFLAKRSVQSPIRF